MRTAANGTGTGIDPSCSTDMTPSCLRQLYNIHYTPTSKKSLLGVTGYLQESANRGDLAIFLNKFNQGVGNGSTFDIALINNGTSPQGPLDGTYEANLDMQYTFSLTGGRTRSVFYSTGGSPPFIPDQSASENDNEPYLEWTEYLLSQDNRHLPQTISTSYGDNEQTVPLDYARRVCFEFAKLGARGVSLLFSSGDGGVGGSSYNDQCLTNDGQNRTRFLPTFPSTCPFVTSVGGTRNIPETTVGFSSGGFSEHWPTPRYQKRAVESYTQRLGNTYKGLFNPHGRAFPDVAAQGRRYRIVVRGETQPISGTSASCPTFAAVISNLNDFLLSRGRRPLGFLNPWLYSRARHALNDITTGSNPGCATSGFNATTGWDPATGLGTPDFAKLLHALQ
ncbi:hypothetical protein HDU91_003590 [Kappamyces sp. JEL0680]|nr:hypothetical protein HDU91_003590 [Kappamyces sp. JEL0680]